MAKTKNERCPLQSECARTCDYKFAEKSCPYYMANARPGFELDSPEPAPAFDAFNFDNLDKEIEEASEIYGYTDDEAKSLTYIPVDQIYPHPDNPRKELGDLGELSDSIKKNGIYQNLTVVPLKSKLKPNLKLNGYTVIIGHRRLAAAKLEGLTEVPCIVADMTEQEQLATMLLENMQRSDLTVYEQAKGFQLMMDFGSSVSDIAEKTGFSETTVRRRVKLLELDEAAFKASEERGATLSDYIRLEQIKDIERRNEVLSFIGTKDFEWRLKKAKDDEMYAERRQEWIDLLSSVAVEIDKSKRGDKTTIDFWHMREKIAEEARNKIGAAVTRKLDGELDNLYWCIDTNGSWIYLITDKQEEVSAAASEAMATAQRTEEKRKRLADLCKTAKALRRNFVSEYTGKKDSVPFLLAKCFERGCLLRAEESAAVELLSLGIDSDSVKNVFTSAEFLEVLTKQPQRALLLALWNGFETGYRMTETYSWDLKYAQNISLQRWYEILEAVGYQISTEEQQMLDGTHPAYKDEEVTEDE